MDKVTLGQVFSDYFCFPCQFSFHQTLHIHLYSWAGTTAQLVIEVPSGLSLTPTHKIKKRWVENVFSFMLILPPSWLLVLTDLGRKVLKTDSRFFSLYLLSTLYICYLFNTFQCLWLYRCNNLLVLQIDLVNTAVAIAVSSLHSPASCCHLETARCHLV
jgi:hypothetical protein